MAASDVVGLEGVIGEEYGLISLLKLFCNYSICIAMEWK